MTKRLCCGKCGGNVVLRQEGVTVSREAQVDEVGELTVYDEIGSLDSGEESKEGLFCGRCGWVAEGLIPPESVRNLIDTGTLSTKYYPGN